jgi:CRISPR/Cas system-associated protein Cas10 (large subunit of type III CRISPR-Cas system)
MEKVEIRTWLAVGGLLHDIGKLIDRSGEGRAEEEEKRRFGYSHAVYSYKFLKELLEGKVSKEVEELILSGSYHHKPEPGNLYHLAQQIADHVPVVKGVKGRTKVLRCMGANQGKKRG